MKYLQTETAFLGDAECAEDAVMPTAQLEARLTELQSALGGLGEDAPAGERCRLLLDSGYVLLDLERKDEAHDVAWQAFELAIHNELWEQGVQACDILFQSEKDDAIKALAHGIWLGVTYPVDPELSVAMLQHLVDETPPRSDGAAVAAATAHYLADMRAQGQQREDLMFFTSQLLGNVAKVYSVENQELFDFWIEQKELDNPNMFIPRLAQVIDVLVIDEWWFDRDALREQLPE